LKTVTQSNIKTRLQTRLNELAAEDNSTSQDRATVTLDQQSVGRLSRMDAMQQQAMANATHQRRQNERIRLNAALKRLNEGEYGYCLDCGDEISPKRLDLDPTAALCITCARG
jgi:RNA polymerase-binding transcription factor